MGWLIRYLRDGPRPSRPVPVPEVRAGPSLGVRVPSTDRHRVVRSAVGCGRVCLCPCVVPLVSYCFRTRYSHINQRNRKMHTSDLRIPNPIFQSAARPRGARIRQRHRSPFPSTTRSHVRDTFMCTPARVPSRPPTHIARTSTSSFIDGLSCSRVTRMPHPHMHASERVRIAQSSHRP